MRAKQELDERERHDRGVDERTRRRDRSLPDGAKRRQQRQIEQREREEVGDEPEVRPGEAIEAREERRQELEEASR